jgi:hypothetical protein
MKPNEIKSKIEEDAENATHTEKKGMKRFWNILMIVFAVMILYALYNNVLEPYLALRRQRLRRFAGPYG